MSIKAQCPHCPNVAVLPDSAAGKTIRCNQCKQTFKIATEHNSIEEPPDDSVIGQSTSESLEIHRTASSGLKGNPSRKFTWSFRITSALLWIPVGLIVFDALGCWSILSGILRGSDAQPIPILGGLLAGISGMFFPRAIWSRRTTAPLVWNISIPIVLWFIALITAWYLEGRVLALKGVEAAALDLVESSDDEFMRMTFIGMKEIKNEESFYSPGWSASVARHPTGRKVIGYEMRPQTTVGEGGQVRVEAEVYDRSLAVGKIAVSVTPGTSIFLITIYPTVVRRTLARYYR